MSALRAANAQAAALSPRQRAAIVGELAEAWLQPASPWLARAVDALTAAGPFSRPMLEHALPRMIEPLRGDAIERLVRRELGDWPEPAAASLVVHILPSNLAGHAAIPGALSLVVGGACLLKSGRRDQDFGRLWVESLRATNATLGACIENLYWRGGDRQIEDSVFGGADVVIAAGSDRAIADIGDRCRGRFAGYGHRLSFAVVSAGADVRAAASCLADDIAIWDQLGCLSPQSCFVQGPRQRSVELAEHLAGELAERARRWPPARLEVGELLAIRRFRDAAAWRGFATGEPCLFAASDDLAAGNVVIDEAGNFAATPLHRCLRLLPFASPDEVRDVVATQRGLLEGAAVAAPPEQWESWCAILHEAGVPQVVGAGELQRPTLEWRQSGRDRLAGVYL